MSSAVPALDPVKLDACLKAADALASRMDAMCGKRDSVDGKFQHHKGKDNVRPDEWSDEARKAAAEARAGKGGGSSEEKKVSVGEASAKVKAASGESLRAALKHPNTDPQVKKLIEKELAGRSPTITTFHEKGDPRAKPSEHEARMLGIKR